MGGTGTREGENTNNARYWCESAAAAAGGGVTSFNGRGGAVQPQAGQGHETHVEEGGAVAAYGKVVGGDFAGLDQNLHHALKQVGPVRRDQGRNEKGQGKEQEKQSEKGILREILDFFHSNFHILK